MWWCNVAVEDGRHLVAKLPKISTRAPGQRLVMQTLVALMTAICQGRRSLTILSRLAVMSRRSRERTRWIQRLLLSMSLTVCLVHLRHTWTTGGVGF